MVRTRREVSLHWAGGDRIAAVLADYPPELLTQFERLLGDLRTTMEEYILHVGATRQSHADAPGEAAPSP